MGFFSDLFGAADIADMKDAIKKWENVLTPAYLAAWEIWLQHRDIVVSKMGLTESQKLKLTCREVTRYAVFSIRRAVGANDQSIEKIVKTRGNTKALELLRKASNDFEMYTKMCKSETPLDKFEKEIQKLTNSR